MKIRTLILLATSMALLAACQKEQVKKEAFDKSLLLGKWHLEGGIIEENGQPRPLVIDSCRQDDFIQLNTENRLVTYFGEKKCSPQEPDTLYRYWHIINGQLDLDNIFYDVVAVTADSMNLRRNLASGSQEFITIDYYYFH